MKRNVCIHHMTSTMVKRVSYVKIGQKSVKWKEVTSILDKAQVKDIRKVLYRVVSPAFTFCFEHSTFSQWANNDLLPNETLKPGFQRKVSTEEERNSCGGHEQDDFAEYRKKFLHQMLSLGFLNENNAPTEVAKRALPKNLHALPPEVIDKTIIFHDESTFQANKHQSAQWAEENECDEAR